VAEQLLEYEVHRWRKLIVRGHEGVWVKEWTS